MLRSLDLVHRFGIGPLVASGLAVSLGCAALYPKPEINPNRLGDPLPGFVVIQLRPHDGPIAAQLAREAHRAEAAHLRPFVELTSRWCRACHWLDHSLRENRVARAFSGTYVIRVDADLWEGRLAGSGLDYHWGPIPAFVAVGVRGDPEGDWMDARAYRTDVPEVAAPALEEFFHDGVWERPVAAR